MSDAPEAVDINHASRAVLAELPGIGSALAGRIVAYREAVEPFRQVDDLINVPGISDRKLAALRAQITVTPAAAAEAEPLVRWDELGEPPADEEGAAAPAAAEESGTVGAAEAVAPETAPAEAGVPAAEPSGGPPDGGSPEDSAPGAWPLPQELTADISFPEEAAQEAPPVEVADAPEDPAADAPFAMPPPAPARERFLPDGAAEARRMGCFPMLGGLLGGVLAIILTLALLALLNGGTLRFAAAARLDTLQQEQQQLNRELEALQSALATAEADSRTNRDVVATLAADTDEIAVTAAALATDIAEIDMAAEDFNGLIAGLRALLDGLPSGEPTPTPDRGRTTPTPTPSAADETATPPPAGDESGVATRTPRPTATPFQTATP